MRTLKVEFTEDEIKNIVNQIVDQSSNNEKCHDKNGHKFIIDFNDELHIHVKVLISDNYNSRYVSTDIQLITVEGFYKVESNIDYLVEDRVNKSLKLEYEKL